MKVIKGTRLFLLEDLEQINWCRRYLEVLTLVDVATGDGERVHPCCFQGIHDEHHPSIWKWPHKKLGHADWALWHAALMRISSRAGQLLPALGCWI